MSQAEFKRRLKALMLRPENHVCSDCPERQPRWASLIVPPPGAPPGSLAMGAFCCLECSGSHRRLGVHISFVRSVNLDQWKEKEVLAMENGGNNKVNTIFEARLNVAKPNNTATGPVRERFIRDKYERRKFYDPSAFALVSDMEDQSKDVGSRGGGGKVAEQDKVISGVQRRLAADRGSGGTIRKPSDAARKRVEERAARNRGGAPATAAVRSKPPKKEPPAPPAPVADLLDFGDFESAEATSAVAAAVTSEVGGGTNVATGGASNEPQLDLFANMLIGNSDGGATGQMPNNAGQQQQTQMQQMSTGGGGGQQQQSVQDSEKKKMSSSEILGLFNTPSPNQNPMQQNMFAMEGGGMGAAGGGGGNMGNMMNNPNNMAMMNTNNNMNNMVMNNGNMGGNNMMVNANGAPGMYGNMGGNNNMMMMGGGGGMNSQAMNSQAMNSQFGTPMNGNATQNYNNNMMMMMQQQQQQQQQQQGQMQQMNNMMGGNNMMMMQGGGQFAAQQQATSKQQQGPNIDQFADFGNFGR